MGTEQAEIAIIGGGVVGCAVLRALTLAGHDAILLERGGDILSGASKANSAILHTGFDAPPGSLEVALMQAGRRIYLDIHDRLNLPILETDAVLVAWSAAEAEKLPAIAAKAHKNGVSDVRPMVMDALQARHPHLAPTAVAALLVPGEHIIDPWSSPLAYALQAVMNGARVWRDAEVTAATRTPDGWRLATKRGIVEAGVVINCAGNFGDFVEALARTPAFSITPRKGQFVVFDKTATRVMPTIVLPVPTERTKGVVLCPTIFGNVLVGPTAEDQPERERATVDQQTLERLITEATRMVPALADEPVTATYAGLRPASDRGDYIIEPQTKDAWITVAGIRSTGLTAALGIGAHVAGLVEAHFQARTPLADPVWPTMPNLAEHRPRDHERAGRGDLVCLCETVTRDEIEAALSGPLPAGDLGGLKRRTRAMMGRCQGFNCLADVCAIAAGRLLVPPPLPEPADAV
ncbi:MAG: NAD(P)/FAD-dependent oxidoreductase [Labrys sp. (in: a-proteobacteria)]